MLRALASMLVPPRCAICAAAVSPDDRICSSCARELDGLGPVRFRLGALEVVSATRYERVARQLVARLKFSGRLALAEPAAEAMVRALPEDAAGAVLVPVPAAPSRARWRGFDVAWLLTGLVADRAGLPARSCLRRVDGPRQVGRSRIERLRQGPAVAATPAAAELVGRNAIVVDDVVTTGATLSACANALRAAGAASVRGLTFARSEGLGGSLRAA
ncbi:MAG TPA: phosphoribosyltransferase family protein [Solirubrobacterales bacterium]